MIQATEKNDNNNCISSCWRNNRLEIDDAKGFQYYLMGHGPVVMSNVFLAAAFIILAEKSICSETDIENKCEGLVYDIKPSSLITVIATASGLLSTFFLPLIGAMVDFTNNRRFIGKCIALSMITIQAIQIATNEYTWFTMVILQAINGCLYQLMELIAHSYLPEIKRVVGTESMTRYASRFYSFGFSSQVIYLVIVIGLSTALKAGDVLTAQIGQAVDVIMSGTFYSLAYYFFTHADARRELPVGKSLLIAGFKQVVTSAKGIVQHYPRSLTWFFLAVLFSEAAVSAFTTVAVTFLVEVVRFDGKKAGLVSLITLISTVPGTFFANFISRKTKCPLQSMKLCLIVFIAVNFVSFLTLAGDKATILVFVYAVLWGLMIGWFYPTEVNIYASLMPKDQEAELAGFYLICTQLLAWLPPLIFTVMNENSISLSWGGCHLNAYLFVALLLYQMMPSWSDCLATSDAENKILRTRPNSVQPDTTTDMNVGPIKSNLSDVDEDNLEPFP